MKRARFCFMAWTFLTAPSGSAADHQPALRSDLNEAFGDALCAGRIGNIPTAAWGLGHYDAQIEGAMVTSINGLPVEPRRLEHKARALASVRHAGGYAYGQCKDQRGWAVTTVATAPLKTADTRISLPLEAMHQRCSEVRADFAAAAEGAPREVPIVNGTLTTSGLGDGVLSITCQPRAPRWQGPTLWFLVPTGHGPLPDPPEVATLKANGPLAEVMSSWVNRMRSRQHLSALSVSGELQEQANLLAIGGTLAHDRLLLRKADTHLGARNIHLIGENRVKGRDSIAMGWLLWNSPRHRELILNADADALGLAISPAGDEQLAVLVFGRAVPLNTAVSGSKGTKTGKKL